MNEFRTSVTCKPAKNFIDLKDGIITLGSCFADTIGGRLQRNKMSVLPNPFGTIYNPHSIHKVLNYATQNINTFESSYVQNNEVFLNFDFHSEIYSYQQDELKNILSK